MNLDHTYMARAIELAKKGRYTTTPNPNVGCVIVRDGHIVGEGFHFRAGEPHAEVHALRMAGEKAKGATAYVTLEPCSHQGRTPPCADALVAAGVARVVVAMDDPNPQVAGRGLYKLKQAGIDTDSGVLRDEAEALNLGFLKRMRTGFPYLRLKMAASLDGRTAMASGESKWITSPEARRDVQRFRAESSAILSTSATVLADDPSLTVRWSELDADIQSLYTSNLDTNSDPKLNLRQPTRVVIDSQNRVMPSHRLIHEPGQTWLARLTSGEHIWPDDSAADRSKVEELILPAHNGGIDLVLLMMQLGKRQINSVWTEAGSTLAGALLQAGLVDELVLYLAPKLLGDNAQGLFKLPGLESLSSAPEFKITDVRQIGPDIRLLLKPLS